jgi:hypothetical protein
MGRFLQPDPLVPEPGNPQSLNRYSYVLNNPLRYTDPTGMKWVEIDGGGAGNISPGPPAASGPAMCPPNMPCPGPAPVAPGVVLCGGLVCGPGVFTPGPPGWLLLGAESAIELIPFYRIGDLYSLARFAASCSEGACDWAYGAAVLPGVTPGMVKAVRKAGMSGLDDARRLAANRQGGLASEAVFDIASTGKTRIYMPDGRWRVPDIVDHRSKVVGEVKSANYVTYTAQLRDMADWADEHGYTFVLATKENVTLSRSLLDEIASGRIIWNTRTDLP